MKSFPVFVSKSLSYKLKTCNEQIQCLLNDKKQNINKEDVEKLNLLMEIQKKIDKMAEWPINFESLITFLITLIVPIINIVLKLLNIYKL